LDQGLAEQPMSAARGQLEADQAGMPGFDLSKLGVCKKGPDSMTKPIPDKAEVAVEYPDKLYIGTFAHSARFDAHLDENGISLTLDRPGPDDERKSVRIHFHFALFAEILRDLARTVAAVPPDDIAHREALCEAAKTLYLALEPHTEKWPNTGRSE
jgi:hypothetical protein